MFPVLSAATRLPRRRLTASAGTIGTELRERNADAPVKFNLKWTLPTSSFRAFSSDDDGHRTYFPGSSFSDALSSGPPPPTSEQVAWQAEHNIDIQRVTQLAIVS